MSILFAILTLLVGVALLFGGYRLARFVIPLWGVVAGLSVGGSIISAMNGTPFLGTFLGVIVGLGLGLLFGALAYMYYSVAVVVLIGAAGYWLGTNFIYLLGLNPGVISFIVGLAMGILFAIIALAVNTPKYFLIVFTAVAGAVATVGSVLLLFGQIPLESFSYSTVNNTLEDSFLWTLSAIALAIIGIIAQNRMTTGYKLEPWNETGGHQLPPASKHHAGTY